MTREAFYDREYNVRAALPEHPQIFARWAERGAMTRRLRACLSDLPYGETPAERLDYFPTQREAAPLLVFIHGGYWRSLDKSDFSWLAPPFVQHGIALALLNYGLAPQTRSKTWCASSCARWRGCTATATAWASIPSASSSPGTRPARI